MGTHPIVGAPRDGVNPGPRPRGEPDAPEGGSAAQRPWVYVPHPWRPRARPLPTAAEDEASGETAREMWRSKVARYRLEEPGTGRYGEGATESPAMGFVNGRMMRIPEAAQDDPDARRRPRQRRRGAFSGGRRGRVRPLSTPA